MIKITLFSLLEDEDSSALGYGVVLGGGWQSHCFRDCGAPIFRAKQSKHSPLTPCDELS